MVERSWRTDRATGAHAIDPARLLVLDTGLGAVVAAAWFAVFELAVGRGWQPVDPGSWRLAGLCLGVAVAGRRAGGAWLAAGLALLYPLVYLRPLVSSFHLLPILVLGFAGAQQRRHLWAVVGACGTAVAVLFSPLVAPSLDDPFAPPPPWQTNWSGLALAAFATLSVILLGAAIASQRRVAADLADRNAELERLRLAEADRAVADERLRISREVHDVVAHHLTAILMRAQAADRVHASRPDEARRAVAWIAEESRDALRATRETISSLRGPGRPSMDGPTGTGLTSDLDLIVERVGEVGLDARLDVRWPAEPALGAEAGLAVRRVVQEALTNVLKHAGASEAVVTLLPVDGGLGVQVTDNGTGAADAGGGRTRGGAGLLGMQERLSACGGRLRYGPTASGGWQVQLWVPVGAGGAT